MVMLVVLPEKGIKNQVLKNLENVANFVLAWWLLALHDMRYCESELVPQKY